MNILFIGDIVGKSGRRTVAKILPDLRKELDADLVIANVENIAHGTGITKSTLEEMKSAGVDAFTSGNHVWAKPEVLDIFAEKNYQLIRPANFPEGSPGTGSLTLRVGARTLLLVNLQGRVFMTQDLTDPFRGLDGILAEYKAKKPDAVIVDLHAEATSEKVAFGFWADSRVAAVVGTHTHVGTADAKILPQGTAYVTDIGMVGPRDSVIGVDKDVIIKQFLTQQPSRHEIPDGGVQTFNAVLIKIDPAKHLATSIERIDRETEI